MTSPKLHLPDQCVMLTRRCGGRAYLIRPDDFINQTIAFEVGKAAERHNQSVHAVVAMSNHIHMGNTDRTAKRSRFMQDTMSAIARTRNRDLDRRGHFWEAGSYGDTVLLDRDAIERKLLYIWLNPVQAGLVRRAEDWPGFMILPRHWGKTIRVEKPDRFYGRKNPEYIEFTPEPPPGYEDMSLEEVIAYFEELLRFGEDEIAELRAEAGLPVVGAEKVCQMDPMDCPTTPDRRSRINPRFATTNGRLLAQAIQEYQAFRQEYYKCRRQWLRGAKGVVFPSGTVALRRLAPVKCGRPAADHPCLFPRGGQRRGPVENDVA